MDTLLYDFLASIERGDLSKASAMIEGEVSICDIQGVPKFLRKSTYLANEFVAQISDCEIQAIERISSLPAKFNIRWECNVEIIDNVTYLNGGYNAKIEIHDKLKIYQFYKDESVDEGRRVPTKGDANG